jgi:hypothetical protein
LRGPIWRVESSLSIYVLPVFLTISRQHSPFLNTGKAVGKLCITGLISKFMKAEIQLALYKYYIVSLLITQHSEIPSLAVVSSCQVSLEVSCHVNNKSIINNYKKYDSFNVDR